MTKTQYREYQNILRRINELHIHPEPYFSEHFARLLPLASKFIERTFSKASSNLFLQAVGKAKGNELERYRVLRKNFLEFQDQETFSEMVERKRKQSKTYLPTSNG